MLEIGSKQSPKGAKNPRNESPLLHLDSKTPYSPRPKSGPLNNRKRNSVSSVSSVSSIELDDGANDSDEDADDEEEPPAFRASSYGGKTRKAGGHKSKKLRLSDDDHRKSGDENDSDGSLDDVYAAVDDITDDDNEEQDVEKLEELMIVESEESRASRAAAEVGNTGWAHAGSFNDHMLLSADPFFDEEQLYGTLDAFAEPGLAEEAPETSVPRHVHFEEADSSSDSDSHTEDEIPSDFLHQDSLDPQLRRMIEHDSVTTGRRRRQSDETFGDSDYGRGNIYHVESDAVSEGSSGYESMFVERCTCVC